MHKLITHKLQFQYLPMIKIDRHGDSETPLEAGKMMNLQDYKLSTTDIELVMYN